MTNMKNNKIKETLPAYFGEFGGMYVGELLVPALEQLEQAFIESQTDEAFLTEFNNLLTKYAGRPTPLTCCRNIVKNPLAKIYLKREDLLHGGAHKTNQVLGQALLAKRMGKTEIIAETGAGQHGVATAIACSLLGLKCKVYMGAVDCQRQQPNVFRMELMGAEVIPVTAGSGTLKDAVNEALRDWSANYENAHYLLGTAAGPHPFPTIVRIQHEEVKLIGVEAGGKGVDTNQHGATLVAGTKGMLHGNYTYIMQDKYGQIEESYSISAGLDYPAVGPQHAFLKETGRAQYVPINDDEALDAFQTLARSEGIIPALESSHALAQALKMAESATTETIYLVNLSGRGDKDLAHVHAVLHPNDPEPGTTSVKHRGEA